MNTNNADAVLLAVLESPRTIRGLSESLSLTEPTVKKCLLALVAEGKVVRQAGVLRTGGRGRPSDVFTVTPGPQDFADLAVLTAATM